MEAQKNMKKNSAVYEPERKAEKKSQHTAPHPRLRPAARPRSGDCGPTASGAAAVGGGASEPQREGLMPRPLSPTSVSTALATISTR